MSQREYKRHFHSTSNFQPRKDLDSAQFQILSPALTKQRVEILTQQGDGLRSFHCLFWSPVASSGRVGSGSISGPVARIRRCQIQYLSGPSAHTTRPQRYLWWVQSSSVGGVSPLGGLRLPHWIWRLATHSSIYDLCNISFQLHMVF